MYKGGYRRPDIMEVVDITGIPPKYGYFGEAAEWITPDGVKIADGGALQLNLRSGEGKLEGLGIMSFEEVNFNEAVIGLTTKNTLDYPVHGDNIGSSLRYSRDLDVTAKPSLYISPELNPDFPANPNRWFSPATDLNGDITIPPTRTTDIYNPQNNTEALNIFYNDWIATGRYTDIKNIDELLALAKTDLRNGVALRDISFDSYLYVQKPGFDYEIPDEYYSRWGMETEHVRRRCNAGETNYDYRITLSTGSELTPTDTLTFLNELDNQLEINQLPLDFKYYGGPHDALILYIRKEDLPDYFQVLEEMKTNREVSHIIPKFGDQKTFCGGPNSSSYYGFSLGSESSLNPRIRGNNYTMTNYSGQLMQSAFGNLMTKYNGNFELITSNEMFIEMQRLHQIHQFGNPTSIEIPFWMNSGMYSDMNK